MKLLLVIIATAISLFALTPEQKKACSYAYKVGKQYDLGESVAGIALVESQCGLYKINPMTNDYGLTQISIFSHLRHLNKEVTHLRHSKYATKLVQDDHYAIMAAILELSYWRLDRGRQSFKQYVSSYNQGNIIRSDDYVNKVIKAIKLLKKEGVIP